MQEPLLSARQALPTLEEVELHFEQWRQRRPSSRQAIPHFLWSEVALLQGRYSEAQIAQRLRLNRSHLKTKTSKHLSADLTEFVEIPLPRLPELQENCSLELRHPNGITLQVKALHNTQLPTLLLALMKAI